MTDEQSARAVFELQIANLIEEFRPRLERMEYRLEAIPKAHEWRGQQLSAQIGYLEHRVAVLERRVRKLRKKRRRK